MNFGQAIEALQTGKKVARQGWNGKGMWLVLIRGSHPTQSVGDYQVNTLIWVGECASFIAMKTADNVLVPWLASQSDMLAWDWTVAE